MHDHWMRRAISLAKRALGQTHPNPLVGAVIVESNQVISEGWHQRAGGDHAEKAALKALKTSPSEDAVMYVTLEPCSTKGNTGACTEAIIAAGIKHVVIGAMDPNPAHAGRGGRILRDAGVTVIERVLVDECTDLNLIFNHWIVEQRPLIAAKMAMTLDGRFSAASGQSKWVTSSVARANVMHWRRYFPAIAVGANTISKDDPSLTARIDDAATCSIRFILDRDLKTLAANPSSKVYTDEFRDRTIVVCSEAAAERNSEALKEAGLKTWELSTKDGHIDWSQFSRRCFEEGICGVYVETGPQLATAMIEKGIADYIFAYQAPKFMSDSGAASIGTKRETETMAAAFSLHMVRHELLGDDVLTRGFLKC